MVHHSYSTGIVCCIAIEWSKLQVCLNKIPILLAKQTALRGWAKPDIVTHESYPDTAFEETKAAASMTSPVLGEERLRQRQTG